MMAKEIESNTYFADVVVGSSWFLDSSGCCWSRSWLCWRLANKRAAIALNIRTGATRLGIGNVRFILLRRVDEENYISVPGFYMVCLCPGTTRILGRILYSNWAMWMKRWRESHTLVIFWCSPTKTISLVQHFLPSTVTGMQQAYKWGKKEERTLLI